MSHTKTKFVVLEGHLERVNNGFKRSISLSLLSLTNFHSLGNLLNFCVYTRFSTKTIIPSFRINKSFQIGFCTCNASLDSPCNVPKVYYNILFPSWDSDPSNLFASRLLCHYVLSLAQKLELKQYVMHVTSNLPILSSFKPVILLFL